MGVSENTMSGYDFIKISQKLHDIEKNLVSRAARFDPSRSDTGVTLTVRYIFPELSGDVIGGLPHLKSSRHFDNNVCINFLFTSAI